MELDQLKMGAIQLVESLRERQDLPAASWIAGACTRCGKCCLNEHYMSTLSATQADVERWEMEGRDDILQYVSEVGPGMYDLWLKDGEELIRCPFLRKDRGKPTYQCQIHETRPEACRDYPVSLQQMIRDECEIVAEVVTLTAMLERLEKKSRKGN